MSSSYIPVPVETEPVDLAGEAFDYLATGAQFGNIVIRS